MNTEPLLRAEWTSGPWDAEPDRAQWRDEATGLPCLAVRNAHLGYWCGYVAVPAGHPAHGKNYEAVDVSAHGGLTYSDACSGDICHVPAAGEPDDVWWLGFDCAHADDLMPGCSVGMAKYGTYRTLDYVKAQCADLAQQLSAMKTGG